jgi:hypothetical protein
MIHFALEPCHRHLLRLIQRRPPRLKRLDDAITRLGGTAKGAVELATAFLHKPTGTVLVFPPQDMITGLVIAPRPPPAGAIPDMHGRLTIDAPPFDLLRCHRLLVFFSI